MESTVHRRGTDRQAAALLVRIVVASGCLLSASWRTTHPVFAQVLESGAQAPSSGEQPEGSAEARTAQPGGRPAENAAGLEVFYLKDEHGKLVPVPGLSLEDFERLYALDRKLKQPFESAPPFVLQEAVFRGKSTNDRAEMELVCRVRLETDGWVQVPLAMGTAIVRELPEKEARLPGDDHGDENSQVAVAESIPVIEPPAPEPASGEDESPATGEGDEAAEMIAGGDRQILMYDSERGGYLIWLKGRKGEVQEIRLSVISPIARQAGESRMRLRLPVATTSQLELEVSERQAVGRTSGDEIVQSAEPTPEVGTLITVMRLSAELDLSWKSAAENESDSTRFLVRGSIQTTISGPHRVRSEASFRVDTFGGALNSLLVMLPANMRLLPSAPGRYRVDLVDEQQARARRLEARAIEKAKRNELAEISLLRPLGEKGEVRVAAESAAGPLDGQGAHELAGFEVLDAAVQYGQLSVTVEGDWAVQWTLGANVTQVELDPEAAAAGASARFDYHQQPFVLRGAVRPKERHTSVEPSYLVYVEPGRVRLEGRLSCLARGARASQIEIDLTDWRFDEVGPTAAVNNAGVALDDRSHVTVPLASSQSGAFEIFFHAHRDYDISQGRLSFSLPRPVASNLAPAVVYVLSADNVALTPVPEQMSSLTPEPALAAGPIAPFSLQFPATQSPLAYRGDPSQATFAAQVRLRPQAVSVRQQSEIRFGNDHAHVRQRFHFKAAYEPLDAVLLEAPSTVWPDGRLLVSVDGDTVLPVAAQLPSASDAPTQPGNLKGLRVELPQKRLGDVEVQCEFTVPLKLAARGESISAVIPLIDIAGSKIAAHGGHDLFVWRPETHHVVLDDQNWRNETFEPAASSPLLFSAAGGTDQVRLKLTHGMGAGRSSLAIRNAWVQTWMVSQRRRDRVVMRLLTNDETIRFALPAGAEATTLEASLNGKRVQPRSAGTSRSQADSPSSGRWYELTLSPLSKANSGASVSSGGAAMEAAPSSSAPLSSAPSSEGQPPAQTAASEAAPAAPDGTLTNSVVLELWYDVNDSGARSLFGNDGQVGMPVIEGASGPGYCYWQLICPDNEHLLWTPGDVMPEMQWVRKGAFHHRQGMLSQADLERWSGGSSQTRPPAAAHQYLFSTIGPLPEIRFQLVERRTVLLAASGAALLAGLALIYVPWLRSPVCLLVVGVAVVGVAFWQPDLAWQLSQASAAGVGLAVAAGLLRASVARRRQGRVMLRGQAGAGARPAAGIGHAGSGVGAPAAVFVASDSRRPLRDSSLRASTASSPPAA